MNAACVEPLGFGRTFGSGEIRPAEAGTTTDSGLLRTLFPELIKRALPV